MHYVQKSSWRITENLCSKPALLEHTDLVCVVPSTCNFDIGRGVCTIVCMHMRLLCGACMHVHMFDSTTLVTHICVCQCVCACVVCVVCVCASMCVCVCCECVCCVCVCACVRACVCVCCVCVSVCVVCV